MTPTVNNRFCVFTSAGDRHSVDHWLSPQPRGEWDLITAYYGSDDREFTRLAAHSAHAFRSKGSKFQNLKRALASEPALLERYDFVWVVDDDLIMSSDEISKMFLIAEQFGFWVCQPAFADSGKISHQITRQQTKDCIRIVNFVEVTCPLFQRDKLEAFMRVYDGSLTGWGIDFWFANILDARRKARFAVVDRVVVVNRKDEDKSGQFREIDLLQPARERQSQWHALRDRYGLEQWFQETLLGPVLADFSKQSRASALNSGDSKCYRRCA